MKLTELLQKVGDENITFQNLTECMTRADYRKKHNAIEIGFLTNKVAVKELLTGEFKNRGFIVWIPEEVMKPIIQEINAAKTISEQAKRE